MKKSIHKTYFYRYVLISCIALCFYSCAEEEFIEVGKLPQNNLVIESVPLSEIGNNPNIQAVFLNNAPKTGTGKISTSTKGTNGYKILTDHITKASYRDYEAYTFRVDHPEQPPFTFDNYVIRENHDGSIEEFILRFEYDVKLLTQDNLKSFVSIKQYDTQYNLLSAKDEYYTGVKGSSSKHGVSPNCTVSTRIFHTIPDGREFEFVEGSVCHHPGECELVIEYIITCFDGPGGGGGGSNPGPGGPGEGGPGEGGPGGGGPGGGPPDNGGPSQPIPIMQPPLGQEGTTNTIEQLQSIIEEPLSIVPSGGEINIKTRALLAYLFETNAPVFEDLNTILASNLYDNSLDVSDNTIIWQKSKAIYDIVKNNNPSYHTSFDSFFTSLDLQEQEDYTKNLLESSLHSGVKSLSNYWPQNGEEWGVLFKLMSPLLLEIGIEFLPFGGVFNSSKDVLAGLSSSDYSTAVVGIVGLIMEFVPWAKLAKIGAKIYDVGKSAFKIFKVAYNFLESMATALGNGIRTVLDGSGVLKLIDESGNQVGRISNNAMEVTKHGIKAVDGSVLYRTAADVNAELALSNYTKPPFIGEVTEFVTKEEEVFVRFHNESNPNRPWVMKLSDVQGFENIDEIRNAYSIPSTNAITHFSTMKVPAGTKIYSGVANGLEGFDGGGLQFFIDYKGYIPPGWMEDPIDISIFFN